MPSTNSREKRLLYISPENREQLLKRAPKRERADRSGSGSPHNRGGGSPSIDRALNSVVARYAGLCDAALARVWSSLPEPSDRAFIRHVLMGVATDDVTTAENPTAYLREIVEAAQEYEAGEEPFTPALLPTLQRFGPWEAVALVDWIEQEKIAK